MKKLLLFVLAISAMSVYCGCSKDVVVNIVENGGDDNKGDKDPDKPDAPNISSPSEAEAMLNAIAGFHKSGILFPGDANNKIEKDSVVDINCHIETKDSSYTIYKFPVSKFARYVKDENLRKAIEALPDQTIKGKLYPYQYANRLFCTQLENIEFKTTDGKDGIIAFYGGITNYSLAGYTGNGTFAIYITPGGIYVDKKIQNDVLYYSSSYYGGNIPYICILQFPVNK